MLVMNDNEISRVQQSHDVSVAIAYWMTLVIAMVVAGMSYALGIIP